MAEDMKFVIGRRRLFEFAGQGIRIVGSMFVAGLLGAIPWRAIDSLSLGRKVPRPVCLAGTAHRVAAGSVTWGFTTSQPSVTLAKGFPKAIRDRK